MKGWTPQAAEWLNSLQKPPQVERKPAPPTKDTKAPAAPRVAAVAQEITFPGKVPGLNGTGGLLRAHWTAKARWARAFDWILVTLRHTSQVRYAGPVRLELIRYSIGRQMDYDNLVSTGKLLIDAIVKAGVIPDDNPAIIAERSYTQERATDKASQRTVIRLIPL